MTEERRSAPRARISGARVTYESAAGDHVDTDALNIGRGGLFLPTAKPLAVGKRITLEIQLAGEPSPWSALGRIVWVREKSEGPQRPSGMGVKLFDVEDAALDAIDRLPKHEAPEQAPKHEAPPQAEVARAAGGFKREPTMVGMGVPAEIATATPIVSIVPGRDRTILGVGTAASSEGEPAATQGPITQRASSPPHKPAPTREASLAREPSVVIDLVEPASSPATSRPTTASPDIPAPVKRRRGGRWVLVLAFLLLAGAAAYALLGTDPERLQRIMGTPVPPSPSATGSPQASTTATIVSWPTASPSATGPASGSASSTPTGHATATSASAAATSAHATTSATAPVPESPEPKKSSSAPSAPHPPKKAAPPEDNPY